MAFQAFAILSSISYYRRIVTQPGIASGKLDTSRNSDVWELHPSYRPLSSSMDLQGDHRLLLSDM
jgi:hypothetical protein